MSKTDKINNLSYHQKLAMDAVIGECLGRNVKTLDREKPADAEDVAAMDDAIAAVADLPDGGATIPRIRVAVKAVFAPPAPEPEDDPDDTPES